MAIIEDGTGKGFGAKVDGANRLKTRSVTLLNSHQATERADSYIVSSGVVTLVDATEQGILYIKNNETRDLHIYTATIALSPSTGGSAADTTRVRIYKNPTTGTLISEATAADTKSNRNFGSSLTLNADVFKGDGSATVTNGTVHGETLINPGERNRIAVDEILSKGDSIAVTYEANDSNTSMKAMASVECFLSDPDE